MGQYWIPVNLDKREYINPHQLGAGLKLLEQAWNPPGTTAALLLLTAAMPEPRGGGDPEAHRAIGHWAGDRVAIVGDYAEDSDLPNCEIPASIIYTLCKSKKDIAEQIACWEEALPKMPKKPQQEMAAKIKAIKAQKPFKDITKHVVDMIEKVFKGKFTGAGWRTFQPERERV